MKIIFCHGGMLCNIFTLHNYFHITSSFHNGEPGQCQTHVNGKFQKANDSFFKSSGECKSVLPVSLLHYITS